jgi:hypothetical protein
MESKSTDLPTSHIVDVKLPASLPEQENTNQHSHEAQPHDIVCDSNTPSTRYNTIFNPVSLIASYEVDSRPTSSLPGQEDMDYYSHETEADTETHSTIFDPTLLLNSQSLDARLPIQSAEDGNPLWFQNDSHGTSFEQELDEEKAESQVSSENSIENTLTSEMVSFI